ncbi:MAG TPA: copper resistance CopC family protein [Stellaceae bacterium]|nr:copper resistance CopC family protein [Stellaceae bacterium]
MNEISSVIGQRRRLLLGLVCAGVAGCIFGIRSARAHAALLRSDPPRRAVLTQSPSQIRLWFSETIEAEYSLVSVVDADGQVVSTARAVGSPTDAKLLILELPVLKPGQYMVRYRVNSIDGHILDAGYQFTLKAAPGNE